MATTNCRACDHPVHYSAHVCPSCGAQVPHEGQYTALKVILWVLLIVMALLIYSCSRI